VNPFKVLIFHSLVVLFSNMWRVHARMS